MVQRCKKAVRNDSFLRTNYSIGINNPDGISKYKTNYFDLSAASA
jgi:hypothetical protein